LSAEDKAVSADSTARPLLRVVAGSPSADELAVVVAVLASRSAPAAVEPAWSLWSRKSRMVRPSLRPGFGAWRASTMPR
jgi:hypothetical protein